MRTGAIQRAFPNPPDHIQEASFGDEPEFVAAPELREWAFGTFIDTGSLLINPDHEHLQMAKILFVWSSTCFKRTGQTVVGTAQLGQQQGSLGKKELLESIYRKWNGGEDPDFIVTICAPYVMRAAPNRICAVVDHELYHCGVKRDQDGFPLYDRETSLPRWAVRGHDVEEFIGVVRRYGARGTGLEELRNALNQEPEILYAESERAVCGCGARV